VKLRRTYRRAYRKDTIWVSERGGSWRSLAQDCRLDYRSYYDPALYYSRGPGFRLSRQKGACRPKDGVPHRGSGDG
jgi:formylglycine-generating enzyme required for sulfatase activity